MDNERLTIELVLGNAITDLWDELARKAENSRWWLCVCVITFPFFFLFMTLLAIPITGVRLAVANADRVIFVLASSFLSFYQVPRKVFYVYISVLASTGFLQFLRYDSPVRFFILVYLSWITGGKSNLVLRRFTVLHFSNPFNRCHTVSKVTYVPVGLPTPHYRSIEDFDFPISVDLNFEKQVGACKLKIKSLGSSSTVRSLDVEAPWGDSEMTFDMPNDNLGKLISYLDHLVRTNCDELICTHVRYRHQCRALSIVETIDHFKKGVKLVQLTRRDGDGFSVI